uniref:MULE transposase domain-containing protein n=1 Tax=Lactuca sativa TaxID=4236 RepID=A0A9R1V8Z4_LACSA|nr:hypothetical protein LSAT_V11C600331910 [Lactuca sativa]
MNPNIHMAVLKYQLHISKMKVFMERMIRKNTLHGNYEKQYNLLRKIFICLRALKQGFRSGRRYLLGLDGCFMKGPFPDQILTVVGLDVKNGVYPLAYVLVEAETTKLLNMGVLPTVSRVFPLPEHRFCLRHILEDMKLHWKENPLKEYLWRCATITLPHIKHSMEALQNLNPKAHQCLLKIPTNHWVRSHFLVRIPTTLLLNTWNGLLMLLWRAHFDVLSIKQHLLSIQFQTRDKVIISTLEYIRGYIMKKICIMENVINKTHRFKRKLATTLAFTVLVVSTREKTCTCRKRELNKIPCVVGYLKGWVHPCYKMETWKKMYNFKVDPINGINIWPKSDCPTILTPPLHHK